MSAQAEWESVFADVSFRVVSVKKSFYGSILFLCRCQSVIKRPLFVPVESSDYKWVETLKVCLALSVYVQFFFFAGRGGSFTHTHTHTPYKSTDHWVVHQSVLQEMMAEASDSPLWLTASRAHCGVVGMVNCLRQEPAGDRIRWEYIKPRLH